MRQPRAGGAETVLVKRTAPNESSLPELFLPAWAEDRAYGLVGIHSSCPQPNCPSSYELAKLDGSTPPVAFGPDAFPENRNGAMLLVRAGASMEVIDLDNGTHAPLVGGNPTDALHGSPIVTATGSTALVAKCNGAAGGSLQIASTSAPLQAGPCTASLARWWERVPVPSTGGALLFATGNTRVGTLLVLAL